MKKIISILIACSIFLCISLFSEEKGISLNQGLKQKIINLGMEPVTKTTPIIDFELENLNGEIEKLSNYKGKVVLLNLWATWCGYCIKEMPGMQNLYTKLKNKGFSIVAVDVKEPRDTVKKFIDRTTFNFPILLDIDGIVSRIYGIGSIPVSYIINRKGEIVARARGAKNWDTAKMIELFNFLLEN